LQDQEIRRQVEHRLEHMSRDAMGSFQGLKRLGGAGEKNPKFSARLSRPIPFPLIRLSISLRSIDARFHERSPRLSPGEIKIVLHITPHPAQAVAQRAPPIRLQRM